MNSFLKLLGLIICILGCVFTNLVWIEVPILGEVKGLNNGAGMVSFGAFFIGGILYLISLFYEEKGIIWGTIILSLIPLMAGFYYYQNVQTIIEKLTAFSNVSIFGMSVGNVSDNIEITWKNGFSLSMFMSAISAFISLVLLLTEEEKPQNRKTHISNNQQNTSIPKPVQQISVNKISNFDNQPYIERLKELFELNKNGIISQEIYEDEKSKILEQQKLDKTKFEEQERGELLKLNSELPTPKIQENIEHKNRPTYISKPKPQKKALDPNVIFIIVSCLLLVGAAIYLFSTKKDNNSVSENSVEKIDSLKEDEVTKVSQNKEESIDKSEIKIQEFDFDNLSNKYGVELATETTNFSLKNGNPNKYIFVSAEKAYMRINEKYEVFNQKKHNVYNDGFATEYTNKKFNLFVNGTCKEKPDAMMDGEVDCEGSITIENKETKITETVYYSGVAY